MITADMPAKMGPERHPLVTQWQWDDDDPWAVFVIFTDDWGDTEWLIERQLLTDGMTQHVGDGDVAVGPGRAGEVVISLTGAQRGTDEYEEVTVCAYLPSSPLWTFLGRTFNIIPPGLESIPDSEYDSLLEDA